MSIMSVSVSLERTPTGVTGAARPAPCPVRIDPVSRRQFGACSACGDEDGARGTAIPVGQGNRGAAKRGFGARREAPWRGRKRRHMDRKRFHRPGFPMTTYLLLALGVVLLTVGGDTLVRGASTAARSLGVSPLLIGLTLVGFGTSTPELVTSLTAAMAGSPGIAVGNVVGSNTANILLILGLTALIAPIAVDRAAFRRDGAMLVIAALVCGAAVLAGTIGLVWGLAMVAGLIAYIVWAWLGAGEVPGPEVLAGGGVVITALVVNEVMGWHSRRGTPRIQTLLADQDQSPVNNKEGAFHANQP